MSLSARVGQNGLAMFTQLRHVLGLRATMILAAEGAHLLSARRPIRIARLYGGGMVASTFGFVLLVLVWIVFGVGRGGRLLRLDPCWAPVAASPRLRRAGEGSIEQAHRQYAAQADPPG
jgi:hypothetical protein